MKGIGTKTAQRITIDLKDKLKKFDYEVENVSSENNTIKKETLSALAVLGFNKTAAEKVIDKLMKEGEQSVENLIKEALKLL